MDENIGSLNLHEFILSTPKMFIGRDWDSEAVHDLLIYICQLSIASEYANECTSLEILISSDNSISITDDGRGLPVELTRIGQSIERPKIEFVFAAPISTNPLRGYYENFGFVNYIGLVLNHLSSAVEIETKFDGKWYGLRCSCGKIIESLYEVREPVARERGTRITFTPDTEIFGDFKFDFERILTGLSELACVYSSVTLSLEDKRLGRKDTIRGGDGGVTLNQETL